MFYTSNLFVLYRYKYYCKNYLITILKTTFRAFIKRLFVSYDTNYEVLLVSMSMAYIIFILFVKYLLANKFLTPN